MTSALTLVVFLYVLIGCSGQSDDTNVKRTTPTTGSLSTNETVDQRADEPLEATDDPASRESESSTGEEVTGTPLDAQQELAPQGTVVTVDRAVSGDELMVSPAVEGKLVLRLIGIDAPETGDEPYGDAARAQAESLVAGRKIALQFGEERTGEAGRLLVYVRLPGGDLLNEFMLLAGYAQLNVSPPNVKYEDQLRTAQRQAKEMNAGIWALPAGELCQLADRGNDIGGGC